MLVPFFFVQVSRRLHPLTLLLVRVRRHTLGNLKKSPETAMRESTIKLSILTHPFSQFDACT